MHRKREEKRAELSLYVPPDLKRRLKIASANTGKTMSEIAIELIEKYLEREHPEDDA
jgi:predicted DNA-binding protein